MFLAVKARGGCWKWLLMLKATLEQKLGIKSSACALNGVHCHLTLTRDLQFLNENTGISARGEEAAVSKPLDPSPPPLQQRVIPQPVDYENPEPEMDAQEVVPPAELPDWSTFDMNKSFRQHGTTQTPFALVPLQLPNDCHLESCRSSQVSA